MRKVQTAAIILFCLWSVVMIGYSIFQLSSLRSKEERLAQMIEDIESHRPEGAPDRLSLPDANVFLGFNYMVVVNLGAMWFFPAFFFLCVFLFAGIGRFAPS